MKRIRETIDFIKEKLKNERTRAITILSLYMVFFAFIILLINTNNISDNLIPENNKEEVKEEKFSNLKENYSYTYNIEIQSNKIVNKYLITGKYFNNESTQTITKLIKDKYQVIDNYDLINQNMLYIENIIKYIENKEYEYQTKYKDGRVLESYKVPLKEINPSIQIDGQIEISVELDNKFITKIEFDATIIDSYLNKNIKLSKYSLEYKKDE